MNQIKIVIGGYSVIDINDSVDLMPILVLFYLGYLAVSCFRRVWDETKIGSK